MTLHTQAFHGDDSKTLDVINHLAKRYPFSYCRRKFRNYARVNDPSLLAHVPGGLFRWTVDAHNDVNRRLGKTKISYDQATKNINSKAVKKISSLVDLILSDNYDDLVKKCKRLE